MERRSILDLAHSGSNKNYEAIVDETRLLDEEVKQGQRINTYSVQTALDTVGFGRFQLKISTLAGLCYMADAMEVMLMSILSPILKCHFQLTSLEEALLTTEVYSSSKNTLCGLTSRHNLGQISPLLREDITSVFVGMCISANFWGVLADKYGRKPVLLMFAAFSGYFGILSSLSPNYYWVLALRFTVGCGLGATPQSMTYYSEFLPTKSRSSCMMAIAFMWAVGSILQSALALLVVPTLCWRWLLGLSSAPLLTFIFTFKAIPESPRFYVSRGYKEDAMMVLHKMAKENGGTLPDGLLIDNSVKDQQEVTQWRDLFRPEYLRTTIMAAVMSFSSSTAYYGTSILTTSLFEHDDGCHGSSPVEIAKGDNTCEAFCETLSESDYLDFMITSLSELPGIFLSMFLFSRFGRKTVQSSLHFAFALVTLSCNICAPRVVLVALLFVARALGNGLAQGNYLFSVELFPTSIRAKGLAWCSGVSRVGIIAVPFIAQMLIQVSAYLSISVFAFLGIMGGVAVMLIPQETADKEMK